MEDCLYNSRQNEEAKDERRVCKAYKLLSQCQGEGGFPGPDIAIRKEDCQRMHLPAPLTKAVLEASSNYRVLMSGGELMEEPAPLTKAANTLRRLLPHAEAE